MHRVFLLWLLYCCCVIFGLTSMFYLGLPQIALRYDHSGLTGLLFLMYCVAEVSAGYQAWRISKQNQIADTVRTWFLDHTLDHISLTLPGRAHRDTRLQFEMRRLIDDPAQTADVLQVPPSDITDHIALLVGQGERKPMATTSDVSLLDMTAERLYERSLVVDFISTRIVWIGIFATILGVIMAFWPMINSGASIETMKSNIGGFFGGIAVAFIPTAVSFFCKILLDCNTRIIEVGVRQLLDKITIIAETEIVPFMAAPSEGQVERPVTVTRG